MEKDLTGVDPVEMTAAASADEAVQLPGGHLCLAFANTVEPRLGDRPHDSLVIYDDLVTWGTRVGILSADQASQLRDVAVGQPEEARAILQRAKDLRETIYRVFSATAAGATPAAVDLDGVRLAYAEAVRQARLIAGDQAFEWDWPASSTSLGEMLWPVAHSAVALLMSSEAKRVKECPGMDDCGWLFFDESKNGSRRWCSMETCGSRSKMRRHYARKRAQRVANEE